MVQVMTGRMVCFQCHSEGEERNGNQMSLTHADLALEENKKKPLHKIGKLKLNFTSSSQLKLICFV